MNNLSVQVHFARVLLLATTVSVMIGCQATGQRGISGRPHGHRCAQGSANCQPTFQNSVGVPQPHTEEFNSETPDTSVSETDPQILSAADAAEMFRRFRGKLRANDNGVVVEADLSFSDVTDEALVSIGLFTEIKELDLTGTQICDDALTSLYAIPDLQSLKLKGTRITSVGMASLTQIPSLILLDASNTKVTDEGLEQAAQWTRLRYLSLNNTEISDAAIPHLKAIKSLKGLSLLHTSVTADGVQALKEALPGCLIVTKAEGQASASTEVLPLQPVTSQSGVAFPNLPSPADAQLYELIELAGKQPQLAIHLASVYSNREQWKRASLVLAAAVAADPNQQPAQLALGLALARSGDLTAAKPFLAQAVGEAEADYNLGLIEYENSLRVCAAHLRQAVAADPSLTDAQSRLIDVQHQLSALKQQRAPVMSVASRARVSDNNTLEVIPAPPVRAATFSRIRVQ